MSDLTYKDGWLAGYAAALEHCSEQEGAAFYYPTAEASAEEAWLANPPVGPLPETPTQ